MEKNSKEGSSSKMEAVPPPQRNEGIHLELLEKLVESHKKLRNAGSELVQVLQQKNSKIAELEKVIVVREQEISEFIEILCYIDENKEDELKKEIVSLKQKLLEASVYSDDLMKEMSNSKQKLSSLQHKLKLQSEFLLKLERSMTDVAKEIQQFRLSLNFEEDKVALVKQFSRKKKELIAASNKMALLMANLSQLVRDNSGTKRELIISCKDIAEDSKEVALLAKELAWICTDQIMRTNILEFSDRIPLIGNQLRILSTVKGIMLSEEGTDEDLEATEVLLGNVQNLMVAVRETVQAIEVASLKMRTP